MRRPIKKESKEIPDPRGRILIQLTIITQTTKCNKLYSLHVQPKTKKNNIQNFRANDQIEPSKNFQ